MIKHNILILVLSLLLSQTQTIFGASTKTFHYGGKQCDLPSVGLRFNTFRDMGAIPFAPPKQTGHVWVKHSTKEKIFGYNLVDLWRYNQMVGQWKNKFITVIVAEIKLPLPSDIPTIDNNFDDVLEKSYQTWQNNVKTQLNQGDEQLWLHYYTGLKLAGNPRFIKGCKNPTVQYSIIDSNDSSMLFLVRSRTNSLRRFMFYYQATAPLDKNEIKSILYSIKSVYIYKPKKTKISQVQGSSKYTKKNSSPKYLASKARVAKSIQNMKKWKLLETDNYLLISNMRSGITIKKFQVQLEKSRVAYQTFFPLKTQPDEISVVKIFEDRDEYISYVGEDMKWTGGLWMPSRKELMISPLNIKSKSKNQMGMLETATHEGFHQYIYYAANQSSLSTWFNEGMATFFEGIKFSGSRSFKILTTNRIEALKLAVQANCDNIEQLINMSQQDYYAPEKVMYNYATGWGLMFYLYKGTRVTKKQDYEEIPDRYYEELLRTHNPQTATKYAWANINMAQFQRDFRKFWKNKSSVKKAIKYDIQKSLTKK